MVKSQNRGDRGVRGRHGKKRPSRAPLIGWSSAETAKSAEIAEARNALTRGRQSKNRPKSTRWSAARNGQELFHSMLADSHLNGISDQIIGAAIRVHREIGPGLLESIYETCLTFELLKAGLVVDRQVPFAITYQGTVLDRAFKVDLLVEDSVIVEVKSVDRLMRVHEGQLIGYLRFTHRKLGLLFNFNVKWLMNDGFRRFVNEL